MCARALRDTAVNHDHHDGLGYHTTRGRLPCCCQLGRNGWWRASFLAFLPFPFLPTIYRAENDGSRFAGRGAGGVCDAFSFSRLAASLALVQFERKVKIWLVNGPFRRSNNQQPPLPPPYSFAVRRREHAGRMPKQA